jgi:hypothetical protein
MEKIMRRYFSNGSKNVIGPKDINKNGKIESWEKARAKGMAEGMGKEYICKNSKKIMIKNFKDIVILLITTGVLILLATIIIGDYIVALEENRPVDESVITLMKMSVTGLIGIIGGYIGGSKN